MPNLKNVEAVMKLKVDVAVAIGVGVGIAIVIIGYLLHLMGVDQISQIDLSSTLMIFDGIEFVVGL
jgi:hypothetical protein